MAETVAEDFRNGWNVVARAEVERRYEAGHRSFCWGPSICLTQSLLAVNSGTSTGC